MTRPGEQPEGEVSDQVREAIRRGVRSAVETQWGKRPITKVLVTRLPRV
mgnify:CR=1 FL=1